VKRLLGYCWQRLTAHFRPLNEVDDDPFDAPYRVFTRDYDLEVAAIDLQHQLPRASQDGDSGFLETNDFDWSRAVESASAIFDRQALDRKQLISNLKGSVAGDDLMQWAIAILVDQSGSMKSHKIEHVAACVRSLTESMVEVGINVELLGFSTAGWRGGFARRDWISAGMPQRPGRLCSLMHIVYKSASQAKLDEPSWQAMLNPNILRENVDGEALEWAASRLKSNTRKRKMIFLVSDGAPVDDSTLSQNGPSYLMKHLATVIGELELGLAIQLVAVGVGYRVDEYYDQSVGVEDLEDLFCSSANLLCESISTPAQ
jgi:cobaltochelatase CobT